MKKIIALFLTICMIATLAACQNTTTILSSDEPSQGSSETGGGNTDKTTVKNDSDDTDEDPEDDANQDQADEQDDGTGSTRKTRPTSKTRTTKATNNYTTAPTGIYTTAPRPTVSTVEKVYAANRKLKVACVGDSITAGGYWENTLGGKLSSSNYEVKGFGKSGATALFKGVDYVNANTNAGKAYVDQKEYDNSLAYGADIVVIMLGTNDSKIVNWPYYGHEFVEDYIEIVENYQKSDSNPMVFIALPPTVYSTGSFQDINNTRIEEEIIPALYEVAGYTGAIVIDTHTPTSGNSSLVSDGVHPSAAGKKVLCETIAAAIKTDTGRS